MFWMWVRKHRSLVIGLVLGGVAGSGVVEVLEVRSSGIPDWYMHLAMWVLLFCWYLLGGWTVAAGRRLSGLVNIAILEVLTLFWITVLVSRVPAEKIVVGSELVERRALVATQGAVVLLGLGAAAMLVVAVAGVGRGERASRR